MVVPGAAAFSIWCHRSKGCVIILGSKEKRRCEDGTAVLPPRAGSGDVFRTEL